MLPIVRILLVFKPILLQTNADILGLKQTVKLEYYSSINHIHRRQVFHSPEAGRRPLRRCQMLLQGLWAPHSRISGHLLQRLLECNQNFNVIKRIEQRLKLVGEYVKIPMTISAKSFTLMIGQVVQYFETLKSFRTKRPSLSFCNTKYLPLQTRNFTLLHLNTNPISQHVCSLQIHRERASLS